MPIGNDDCSVAVVTGGHSFDVPRFYDVFRSNPDITFYPQELREFVADAGEVREQYDVVAFYILYRGSDFDADGKRVEQTKKAIREVGETGTGIVVLHHAILSFPEWDLWTDLCGLPDRGMSEFEPHFEQSVAVDIADTDHHITTGLSPWEMTDETYEMADPSEDNRVLLTTDHPDSMSVVGWTRRFHDSRVFCFQSGHDDRAYSNPQFRTVLDRGVEWTAGDG